MSTLELLLRSPEIVIAECEHRRDLRRLGRLALLLILLGGALFGAAVGSYRGGAQLPLAAAKIPVVTIATLALCGPGLYALSTVFGRAWPLPTVVALALVACARASLVLMAFAPVLWLVIDIGTPYHVIKLTAVLCYGLAGASALSVAIRALGTGPGRRAAMASFIALFLVVGGQTGWLLRPYLGQPEDVDVPWLARGPEGGGLLGALWRSGASLLPSAPRH